MKKPSPLAIHMKDTRWVVAIAVLALLNCAVLVFFAWVLWRQRAQPTTDVPVAAWVASVDPPRIPHVLHQVWINFSGKPEGRQPFRKYDALTNMLRELHPTWQYRLWYEEDVVALIEQHFPWFLDTYRSYDAPIKKHDAARVIILAVHGGVYTDHDTLPLRPFDDLLANTQLLLATDLWHTQLCNNSFMACTPRHPVMLEYVVRMNERWRRRVSVLSATGQNVLCSVLRCNKHYLRRHAQEGIRVVEGATTFPLLERPLCTDEAAFRKLADEFRRGHPAAYAANLSATSWRGLDEHFTNA
jgi:hypothetical protein